VAIARRRGIRTCALRSRGPQCRRAGARRRGARSCLRARPRPSRPLRGRRDERARHECALARTCGFAAAVRARLGGSALGASRAQSGRRAGPPPRRQRGPSQHSEQDSVHTVGCGGERRRRSVGGDRSAAAVTVAATAAAAGCGRGCGCGCGRGDRSAAAVTVAATAAAAGCGRGCGWGCGRGDRLPHL